jgi:hypothetical protein
MTLEHTKVVISRSSNDEKSIRSLALLGTWISPYARNDKKFILYKNIDRLMAQSKVDWLRSMSVSNGQNSERGTGILNYVFPSIFNIQYFLFI